MTDLSEHILLRLAEAVDRNLGLHFPRERWPDLARGVESTCRDLGLSKCDACTRELLETPMKGQIVELLGRHLTIGETYFFREQQVFRALEADLLPSLLERRRREGKIIRLWSAACATGEEPYSLAIMLRRLLPDVSQWNVSILATDINAESLRRAEEGIYREWSFRGVGKDLQKTWFTRLSDGRYRICPEVREMVTFASHNLIDDPYPSLTNQTNAMDVIFCRNVLMYFSEKMRQRVMGHLERSLLLGGLLAVGGAESTISLPAGLVNLRLPDATLFRKEGIPGGGYSSEKLRKAPLALRKLASPRKESGVPRAAQILPLMRQAYERGDYEAVCRYASSLPHQEANLPDAALIAARSCANLGKLQEAFSWVERAIALNRVNAEAHYLRAMILDEQNETAQALDSLRTTIYLNPNFIPAYVAKGNISRREGDRAGADRNFRNALTLLEPLDDDVPVPHSEEMRAGRLREAILAAMGGPDGT